MADLLRLERHEDGQRLGGERAQGVNAAQAKGSAVTRPSACCQLRVESWLRCLRAMDWRVSVSLVQFLLAVRQMHQRHHGEHHALVTGGKVIQHLAGFLALLLEVIRDNGGKVIVAVLPALPVGDVGFHAQQPVLHLLHRLVRGDWDNVDGQHERAVQLGQSLIMESLM